MMKQFTQTYVPRAIILPISLFLVSCASSHKSGVSLGGADIRDSVVTVYSLRDSSVGVSGEPTALIVRVDNAVLGGLIEIEKRAAPQYTSAGQPRWATLPEGYAESNSDLYRALREERGRVHLVASPAGAGKSFVADSLLRDAGYEYSEILDIDLGRIFRGRINQQIGTFVVKSQPDVVLKQLQGGSMDPGVSVALSSLPGVEGARSLHSSPQQRSMLLTAIEELPDEEGVIQRRERQLGGIGRLVIVDGLDELSPATATAILMAMLDDASRPGQNDLLVVFGRGESFAVARPNLDDILGSNMVVRNWELQGPTIENRAELRLLLDDAIRFAAEVPTEILDQPELVDAAEEILDRWMRESHELRASMAVLQHANWIIGAACRAAVGDSDEPAPWQLLLREVFANQLDRGARTHGRPTLRGDPVYLAAMYAAAVAHSKQAINSDDGSFFSVPHQPLSFAYNGKRYAVDTSNLLDHSGFTVRNPHYVLNAKQKYHPLWMMRAWIVNSPSS
jgi:hypothetical protein